MQKSTAKEKDEIWGRWRSFNTSGLKVPLIQPKTMITHFLSLTGKEFRVVLQAAPFIFFHCSSVSKEEREAWLSLSHLSPYIFQTEITNMASYLEQLNNLIHTFLQSVLQLSAQWCNKPKFHMLIHICDTIEHLGPACLFATENFEGYNGNTRASSIHSNHLSPSKDIANSFNNHRLMRSITAGCLNYDTRLHSYIRASSKVTDIFKTNVLFQKVLGYNANWDKEQPFKMGKLLNVQPGNPQRHIPNVIFDAYNAKEWKVLSTFTLRNGQTFRPQDFVSAAGIFFQSDPAIGKFMGRVKRIWGAVGFAPHQCKVEVTQCITGEVSEFYGMREVQETANMGWLNPEVHRERAVIVERCVSKHKEPAVIHTENPSFILNSAAFYSTELHQEWAQITFGGVTEAGWRSAVETGIKNWEHALTQKQQQKDKQLTKGKGKEVANSIVRGHATPNVNLMNHNE
ncbi:hypothetical protein DFH28DRAFT_1126628 [Melampsora americana]|nr:hypothetical protein DFH28DRAFT_1126628 [Melampsora americana]